jgi:hypothetical protein
MILAFFLSTETKKLVLTARLLFPLSPGFDVTGLLSIIQFLAQNFFPRETFLVTITEVILLPPLKSLFFFIALFTI